MDTATIIAIVIGCINVLALAFVAYQTMLTRKSVQLAQRTTEISDLSKINAVIHVRMHLNNWKTELEQIITDEKAIRTQVQAADSTLGAKYGLETPKGLIFKPIYDGLPPWLQTIIVSAAQYYYDCKSLASFLSKEEPDSILRLLPEIISRAEVGVFRIKEMLNYIEKMAPEWYLNCPASIQDDKFMDR